MREEKTLAQETILVAINEKQEELCFLNHSDYSDSTGDWT